MSSFAFRFKRFVKRHNHLLTYVGALIVFLTFVVKEGLSDRWRATAETIDMAQYIYGIRSDAQDIREELSKLRPEENSDVSADDLRGRYDFVNSCHSINLNSLARFRKSFQLDNLIVETLPEENDVHKIKERVDLKLELAQKQVNNMGDILLRADPIPPVTDKADKEKLLTVAEQLCGDLQQSSIFLEGASLGFEMRVLREAEITRKLNEKRARYAKWISTGLFTLGWGLGLVGKLYGVEAGSFGD